MLKFTIKRSEWDRGRANDTDLVSNPVSLFSPRRSEKNMCCLGFLSLACGHSLEQIKNVSSLDGLEDELSNPPDVPPEFDKVVDHESDYIKINDAYMSDEKLREKYLTNLFLEDGIEVEFVD